MAWLVKKRAPTVPTGPVTPWSLTSKWHLLGTLFLTIALPLAGLAVLVSAQARSALRDEAVNENRTTARLAAILVREHFNGLRHYIASIVYRPSFIDAIARHDVAGVEVHLRNVVDVNPAFDRTFVVDSEGILWADAPQHDAKVIGMSFAYRDWFRELAERDSRTFPGPISVSVVKGPWYLQWPSRSATDPGTSWAISSPRTPPPCFRRG